MEHLTSIYSCIFTVIFSFWKLQTSKPVDNVEVRKHECNVNQKEKILQEITQKITSIAITHTQTIDFTFVTEIMFYDISRQQLTKFLEEFLPLALIGWQGNYIGRKKKEIKFSFLILMAVQKLCLYGKHVLSRETYCYTLRKGKTGGLAFVNKKYLLHIYIFIVYIM